MSSYPWFDEYMRQNPLGLNTYPDHDARIYKNAHKLISAREKAKRSQQPESGTGASEGAPEASSTEPAAPEPVSKQTRSKKRKAKKKAQASIAAAASTESKVGESTPTDTIALDTEDSTTPVESAPVVRVLTDFAEQLAQRQLELYILLRANLHMFMDKTCQGILDNRISLHEKENKLKGMERAKIGKRYSWEQLRADISKLCCGVATPGYYFLPLYTTVRLKNQSVSQWGHVISTIHRNLANFAADWGKLSQMDAMKRLYSFISTKEREVMELELQKLHPREYKKHNKCIRTFFESTSVATALRLINEVDPEKFPHGYDPFKHTPDAIKQTLYSHAELEKLKSNEKSVARQLKEAKAQIAALQRQANKKSRKRDRDTEPEPAGRKRPKAPGDKSGDNSAAFKALMKPNKAGKLPCPKCAKVGLRIFHDVAKCDPTLRAKNAKRKRDRDKDAKPVVFPPENDEQRKFKLASYPANACTHCKREDVNPKYATKHEASTCYRRPGGECDSANAKTRGERSRHVRSLLNRRETGPNKGNDKSGKKKPEKAQRGGAKRVTINTEMLVKPLPGDPAGYRPTQPAYVPEVEPAAAASSSQRPPLRRPNPSTPAGDQGATSSRRNNRIVDANAPIDFPCKKLRTKNFPKSAYALEHPMTHAELKFAMGENMKYVSPANVRYGLEKKGQEVHLMQLRERMRAAKKAAYKAQILAEAGVTPDAEPKAASPNSNPKTPSASSSQAESRSASSVSKDRRSRSSKRSSRKRSGDDTTDSSDSDSSYSDSDSDSDSPARKRSRSRRRKRRRHRRKRDRRQRRKGRRKRRRGRKRGRSRKRSQHSHGGGAKPQAAPNARYPSPPGDPPKTPEERIPTPPPSPEPTPPPSPPEEDNPNISPCESPRYTPTSLPDDIRSEPDTYVPDDIPYITKVPGLGVEPYDIVGTGETDSNDESYYPYGTDEEAHPSTYTIVSEPTDCCHSHSAPNSCNDALPNVWCDTHPSHASALRSSLHGSEAPQEKAQEEEDAVDWLEKSFLNDLPLGGWLPSCSRMSHKISMPNDKYSPFDTGTSKRLPSETKGSRLLQVFMEYRDTTGATKIGRVKLDTQSNGCYALPGISLPRKWRPWEPKVAKGIGGTYIPLGDPLYFTVMKNGTPIQIDANSPTPGVLSDGCVALLGTDVIYNLGIDLHYAIKHEKHMPVKYLDEKEELIENRKLEAYAEYGKRGLDKAVMYKTCHLSERVVQQYLDTHPDDYAEKPIDIESVDINPKLPRRIRELLLQICKKFAEVFARTTNTLPPAMEGIEPHMFKMKEGYVHRMAPRPTFSPARAKAINEWLDWALKVGLVEEAPHTSYASRLILAAKRKGSTPKSAPPDGIRVAWAGVDINEGIEKTVPTYTDAWQQLYKVANMKYKFSADGLKQYWSIPLCEKAREITAFWTPRGLFQFTRMVMGTKNAATVAQNAYTRAMHTKLPKRSFPNIANFADDFLGGANTGESLVEVFEDFLLMCKKAKITLNPTKVRIGYEKEQFFGLTVDNGKIEPAMRNIDPVINMTYPKNRSELRSVMGVFNQFSGFIRNYGRGTSPAAILNSLASPKAEWSFTERHKQALDTLKQQVQEEIHLYAPDNTLPLVLETDGSDDGWGAVLYQMVDGRRHIIKMWSKQWETEAWQKKPPYHREAKAWMNGMTLALPYVMCNPFPLQCWTDHSPLTWVKHTSGKGPVSQFIIDTLSHVDYEMNYLKGKDNVIADGLSRFPMLGPQRLMRTGLSSALDVLLSTLLNADVETHKIWFDARKDTKFLLPNLFDWFDARRKLRPFASTTHHAKFQDSLSESKLKKLKFSLGIWAPPADKICRQVRAAIKRNIPFACLVPSDLIDHISVSPAGEPSAEIQRAVDKADKIVFLSTGLTWLIHGIKLNGNYKQVYSNDRVTPEIDLQALTRQLADTDRVPPLPTCRTREDWVREQIRMRTAALYADNPKVFTTQDGLLVYEPAEGLPLLTVVPMTLQKELVKYTHYSTCHMSAGKLYYHLKKRFYFKNMFNVCKEIVGDCALCNLLKARKHHAHKHFRAKLAVMPRTSYGADYYSVKKNKFGYDNILGIIDLSTGNLVLRAVQGRNATNTAHTLFYDVVLNKGIPLLFHSDAAKEFLSTAMSSLQNLLGMRKSDTLAHNPKSNAKIERVWEFVGRSLRSMTAEQYAHFHLYMPIIAHVWNTTIDSDTKITPFEAEHGMRCRSVAESLLENPPHEGLPASASDLNSIAIAANAFNEIISNVKAVERANAANKLNSYGEPMRQYNVGDKVAFYLPPNEAEARRMGKNPKHMLQYQGPAVIVEALSDNGTAFKLKCGNRTYRRNIMHMSPYTSARQVPAELQLRVDNSISPGSFVAVLDSTDETRYHVAKILDVGEQSTILHYYATKCPRLRDAKWKALYAVPRSNRIVMEGPDTRIRDDLRYTGTIDTRPLEDSLILLPNIGFTPNHKRINVRTRNILNRKPGNYKHHVLMRTWNPANDNRA